MAALMAALFAVALIEAGGRTGWLAATLATRYRRAVPVVIGIVVVMAALLGLGAAAGAAIGTQLSVAAGNLLLALALLSAGVGAIITPKPPAGDSARGGPLVAGLVGGFALGLGGSSQFLVLALAARDPLPYAAAVGGLTGIAIVVAVMASLGEAARARLPLAAMRYGTGGILIVCGAIIGLTGFRLI